MKGWIKKILSIIPVEVIIDFVLDWLADEAKKTDNDLDDKAVEVVRAIFDAILLKEK
jgi:hypothetical protein